MEELKGGGQEERIANGVKRILAQNQGSNPEIDKLCYAILAEVDKPSLDEVFRSFLSGPGDGKTGHSVRGGGVG